MIADNSLWGCGSNTSGPLGIGRQTSDLVSVPVKITFFASKTVKEVACHIAHHTLVLTESNELYITGSNYQGQLTFGDKTNRTSFQRVNLELGRDDVLAISVGEANTYIVIGTAKKGWTLRNIPNFSDVLINTQH